MRTKGVGRLIAIDSITSGGALFSWAWLEECVLSDPQPQQKGGCFAAIGQAVVVVVVLVIGLILVGMFTADDNPSPAASVQRSTWTPPAGFQVTDSDSFSGGRIGYRWLEAREFKCDYGRMCLGMEFVSEKPCDFFYAGLSLLDSSGANVGMTNDTTSGVQADQRVIMVFRTYEERARSAELSKVTCS